ncbi:unnamed protein product [Arctia plantaginis]|uniref:Transposable element P transposase-like RNase H domain-containing protein n=1 Tax=Arctia plantaginis TaxID=874455 RepID=A0A8S0ZFJ8_ARCPL|nr:unnamed protein product [Arctia plantaginis]
MGVHLNLEILETARQAGQNVLNLRTDAREVLPDYQALPQSIVDYISHIASVITQDGKEIRMNLPATAIPQGPIEVDGVLQPSGSFGPIAANNHNTYECYLTPLITSRRVQASQENNAGYLPLPDAMIPGNLVPNRNMLGFEQIDILGAGANSRLQGIQFPNDDTLEGRYRISTLLQDRVYTVLAEMKDRFKIVEYRRNQNDKGLNIMDKIQHKITAVNLLFVETSGPLNDAQVPLYSRNVAIHGFGAQGSASANQANIECFHRRRIHQGNQMARGFCCTTQQGQPPGGWNATLNDNFNMHGLYAPVLHADYPHLRESHFSSHASAGVRTTALAELDTPEDMQAIAWLGITRPLTVNHLSITKQYGTTTTFLRCIPCSGSQIGQTKSVQLDTLKDVRLCLPAHLTMIDMPTTIDSSEKYQRTERSKYFPKNEEKKIVVKIMPRIYIRKTNRQNWPEEQMQKALDAVRDDLTLERISSEATVLKTMETSEASTSKGSNPSKQNKGTAKYYHQSKNFGNLDALPSTSKILTLSQFREFKKGNRGRRFTLQEKLVSLSITKQSSKGYRFLRKIFKLPSRQILLQLLHQANFKPGINSNTIEQLKKATEAMKLEDKLCILLFDEMSLKPSVAYNERKDRVCGFVTNGDEVYSEYADHAQVFMIRGLLKNYKQPVAYTISQAATKGPELPKQLKAVVTALQGAGLTVVVTVCDK